MKGMNKVIMSLSICLVCLLFGACTDEQLIDVHGGNSSAASDDTCYIAFTLHLPGSPQTRALTRGDSFDDGTYFDNAIYDVTMALHAYERSGVYFIGAYKLTPLFSDYAPANDQITLVAQLTSVFGWLSKEVYQFPINIVVNHNDIFSVEDDGSLVCYGTRYTPGSKMTGGTTGVLAKIKCTYLNDPNWHKRGITMTQAAWVGKPGGRVGVPESYDVSRYSNVLLSDFQPTREKAIAHPVHVYLQRAECKVTVTQAPTMPTTTTGNAHLPFRILGWVLDNTCKDNYLIQDHPSTNIYINGNHYVHTRFTSDKLSSPNYRYVGETNYAVLGDSKKRYRFNWEQTLGYGYLEKIIHSEHYNTIGGDNVRIEDSKLKKANGVDADYCFPNAVSIRNMQERYLTRVIVKAQFNDGRSFYTIDGSRSVIVSEDDAKKEVAARLLANETFAQWITDNLDGSNSISSDTDFDVVMSDEPAGKRTVKSIVLNASGNAKLKAGHATYPDNAATLANSSIKLEYYANGESYYPVYVRHFSDEETPWSPEDNPADDVYGAKNNDDLANSQRYEGRYSMVRNNWYALQVSSVKELGAPNVEKVTASAPDKKETHVQMKFDVQPWTKRGMTATFE